MFMEQQGSGCGSLKYGVRLWKCYSRCVRGAGHREKGMLCQDRVAYSQKGSRQSIALVDGVGKTDRNVIAGEKIAVYMTEYLQDNFEKITGRRQEDIKYDILLNVRRIIESLMVEFGMPEDEFASTIMALCIDHSRGRYCGVHLGDGIMVCRNGKRNIMSYPENGQRRNQTYLTTSEGALQKMKILRGVVQDTTEYMLMSDGVYSWPADSEKLCKAAEYACADGAEMCEGEDDRSIILLRSE